MKKVKLHTRLFYMLPAVVIFVGIVVVPVIMSLYNSLFNWNGISEKMFVGLDNFKELIVDKQIFGAIVNTFKLTFASVVLQLPISMFIALLVKSKKTKGKRFFQSIYFLPVILSASIVGILWTQIYDPNIGLINTFLEKMGLENLQHAWLGEKETALYAVVFVMLWFYVGNYVLIYISALSSIPTDVMEYAELDGALPLTTFFKIQLPLVWPTIQLTTMLVIVNSLRYFDMVYIMTGGGPNHSTDVLATVIVGEAFDSMRFGYASAISVFLFLLGTIFIIVINRLMKRESVY